MKERKERIRAFFSDKSYHPLRLEELVTVLDVPEEDRPAFKALLDEMEAEGQVYKTKRNRYGVPERLGFMTGKLQGHERGFGFVIPEYTDDDDLFIPADSIHGAMHGDRVIAKITKLSSDQGKAEGEIVKILSRANEKLIGVFDRSGSFGFVIPDHRKIKGDIFVPIDRTMGALPRQKVVVEITRWPESQRNAEGRIVEILGDEGEKGVDILSVIKTYGIPTEFPDEVMKEAEEIPTQIRETDIKNRRDLRQLTMVTIDGEDARDLDDAVSLEMMSEGVFRLGVHIADVTHYVREGTPLDNEAADRGTSVYFPDRVIPMLPKALSNGICSLNPKVDRLSFSVLMDIDSQGHVVNHEIVESVINVNERMTYTSVYKILEEKDAELIQQYQNLIPMFENMKELALILKKKRNIRGAIDFDFGESRIIVDEQGKPVAIERYRMTIANKIIEEFMLICNETVSEHFYWANIPFVYRIHEDPDPDKIKALNLFLFNFGHRIKGSGSIHPRALQDVLERVKGSPQERMISTMMLRSLQKARYSHEHEWHFGLAASYYSHFTSPIRRYPDLMIHRIMKEYLRGEWNEKRSAHYEGILPEIAKNCSERERNADEAERECDDLKKAEYMKQHIGEEFSGVVAGVTSFGLFIELENSVEGLIRLSSMDDDYYWFDEKQFCLIGERTGKIYRIGDVINVIVVRSSPETRQIDFIPADAEMPFESDFSDTKQPLNEKSKPLIKGVKNNEEQKSKRKSRKTVDKHIIRHVKGKGKKRRKR